MKTLILTIRFLITAFLLSIFSGNAFSYIISVSPQINSQNLDTRGNIVVSFMYEMDATTMNDATVIIDGSQSGRIHTTVSYNSTDYTATINPVRNLKAGENIHVYLTSGIQTLYHGSIYPYMYNFNVKPTGGSGIFDEIVTSNLGSGSILGMNTGDFDGDGDLDLILIRIENGENKLFIIKNDGTGRFTDTASKTLIASDVGGLNIGDYDNDGDIDAAVIGYFYYYGSTIISFYTNNGSGEFSFHSNLSNTEGRSAQQGDIDNDGDIDFVILGRHQFTQWRNNGDGVFENSLLYVIGCQYYYMTEAHFTLGDFDADNDLDIYYIGQFREEEPGYNCQESKVYLNNGGGGFDRYTINNSFGPSGMVTGDLNNDRKIDIIMPPFRILYFIEFIHFGEAVYPGSATTGDFDGDGDLDLINAGAVNDQPVIYFNDGNGNFTTGSSFNTESEGGGFPCADFDNDGDLDILKGGGVEGVFNLYKNFTFCSISGSPNVIMNSINLYTSEFDTAAYFELSNFDQTEARIVSDAHNDSVFVDAGNRPGHFVLYLVIPDSILCTKHVYVDNPLPVELASFTSAISGRNVTLNWSTVSELNNSGFDIEKSIVKGQTSEGWSKIGFINGSGTISEPQNYSFTDKNLATGKYKYRLKQIDFNGNFEYFELAEEVSIGIPDKYELSQNYPNPFNPVTNLEYSIAKLGFVSLKIYDVLGRELVTLVNEIKEPGYYKIQFNASNLSSGVYFYRLVVSSSNPMSADDFVAVKKFVVMK